MQDSQIKKLGNMKVHDNENNVVISLNSNIFTLAVVQSASYMMLDKAFIVIDGDPKKEIIIELRPKEKGKDVEELGREFNNELINYTVNKIQLEKNKEVKDTIIQQELATSQDVPETGFEDGGFSRIEENLNELEQSSLDDPLGISEPWEDTHIKTKLTQKNQETIPSDDLIPIDKIKSKQKNKYSGN